MATHPFAASVTRVSVPGAPISATATAKTIGALNPVPDDLFQYIKDFLIPTEFAGVEEDDTPKNFRVNLGDLIRAITKSDLGLENVDNTSDLAKPISNLVEQALRAKFSQDNKPSIGDVDGLEDKLANFYAKDVEIEIRSIAGLAQALSGKADAGHTHTREDFQWLDQILQSFAPVNHSHSLSNLDGWNTFIESLNTALLSFVTVQKVDERIDTLALTVGTYDWE